jgi:hypothetical protein
LHVTCQNMDEPKMLILHTKTIDRMDTYMRFGDVQKALL